MEASIEVRDLSHQIRNGCVHTPTRTETEPFYSKLEVLDIKEFIIYNFLHYQIGIYLKALLLATFKFWKELTLNDWREIFMSLKGNKLAEYYMTVIVNQYLGITPKFKSTRSIEINYFTPADDRWQSGKPSLFVGDIQGQLRKIEEENLDENYGLNIRNFVAISSRLKSEMSAQP